MHDDEPKPKRRSALRHALGGLALLGCVGTSVWMLEQGGWTNWNGVWRRTWAQFNGSQTARKRVQVGMTWGEVRGQVGDGNAYHGDVTAYPPGPICRVAYPEYGFIVVYHLPRRGVYDPQDDWIVIAVEDLP